MFYKILIYLQKSKNKKKIEYLDIKICLFQENYYYLTIF